jgi:hypothetical protein
MLLGTIATQKRRNHGAVSSGGGGPVEADRHPMFVPQSPTSQEFSNYDRTPFLFFWTTNTINWTWRFESTFVPGGAWPSVRALVDGVPVTAFVSPASNSYPFSFTAANGHHVISFEIQSNNPSMSVGPGQVLAKDFIVNTSGAPLPTQAPWTSVNRFERDQRTHMPASWAQVTYPGAPVTPHAQPFKARTIEPYTTVQAKADLWARAINLNVGEAIHRFFVTIPTGDVAIELGQKFTYSTFTGSGKSLATPYMNLRDGVRGVGLLGSVYKTKIRSGGGGYYLMDTQGRLAKMTLDGDITTLVGWRVIPGQLKAHSGIKNAFFYMYTGATRTAHLAYYDSKWEYLGDWTQVNAGVVPRRFHEPRGFAMAQRLPSLAIDNTDGKELWVCDTLHHRILYVNLRTMDPPESYEQPHFPPAGYIAPAVPTGLAEVYVFGGTGESSGLFNEPFDCDVDTVNGRICWTNYAGGSICSANMDGTGAAVMFQGSPNPTDAQLALPARLAQSGTSLTTLRSTYLIDGSSGTCTRPQAIGFTSDGQLYWTERYTYALRKLAAGVPSTVALLPVASSSQFNLTDTSMAINSDGTCGPLDGVYVDCFHDSDFHFSKNGTYLGRWKFTGADLASGPLSVCQAPSYSWGVACGGGRIVTIGNASGWQFQEITKRQPSDIVPDTALVLQGRIAHYRSQHDEFATGQPIGLLHGTEGMGELGYQNFEAMGALDDATLDAYGIVNGVESSQIAAWRAYVRHSVSDKQY